MSGLANGEDGVLNSEDAHALVSLTVGRCRLQCFYMRLKECSKIFIPIRHPNSSFWFLLEMNLGRQKAVLWESSREFGIAESRMKINLLLVVYEKEMKRTSYVYYCFPAFELVIASSNPTHENSNESGIFTIRHMQHHDKGWYEKFNDEEHRSSLCIETETFGK